MDNLLFYSHILKKVLSFKFKTFYEVKTARHFIQFPNHQIKASYVSGVKKVSYGYLQEYIDICFASALRIHFLDV